jgi:hypothetical protein
MSTLDKLAFCLFDEVRGREGLQRQEQQLDVNFVKPGSACLVRWWGRGQS